MKSSTYASIATIVFLQHKNEISKSIESVIRSTDNLCQKLNFSNNLSHMTKYRIIADLLNSNLLIGHQSSKNLKLKLSQNVIDLL